MSDTQKRIAAMSEDERQALLNVLVNEINSASEGDDSELVDDLRDHLAPWGLLDDDEDDGLDEPEDCADDEPTEPEEGDLVTEDHIHFWEHGSTKRCPAVTVQGDDTWQNAVRAYQNKEGFWGNIWSLSDHGNYCLLSLTIIPE